MRILKKILLCAFIALCVLSLVSCTHSGYCGAKGNKHNVKWELDDDGTLIISGKGKMASYGSVKRNKSCGTFVLGNPEWNGSLKNDI